MTPRIPRLGDALIASTIFVLSVILALWGPDFDTMPTRPWDALGFALLAAQTLPLAWRQRNPRVVAWVSLIAWMVLAGNNYAVTYSLVATLVALYGLAAYLPRRAAMLHGGLILAVMLLWTGVGMIVLETVQWTALLLIAYGVCLPMAIGFVDHRRTQRLTELERTEARREQAEREAAVEAVAAERARIARELHDVVAHEMTVMTLQAEGARRMGADEKVTEALATIAASGRKGLVEMQRVIGVLRASEGPLPSDSQLAPMPSLAALPQLVRQVQDSGMPVALSIEGDSSAPAGVELSAYRIVQESLTNALKYAGPGASATVEIVQTPESVSVTVTDDGRGAAAGPSHGGGHGVRGMRERVEALGGTLDAGPLRGGGYIVRATLPTDESVRRASRADVGTLETEHE